MLKFVASRVADSGKSEPVGKVVAADKSIIIACGANGSERIEITRVLPEGKGRMDTADYLRGRKLVCGDVLN